ncbi:MAG: tetratricopeptide repeat protein [Bacteroidia bacterium]|nr:tetratricopeptide repeat protein [Bacteroidia bacterium]
MSNLKSERLSQLLSFQEQDPNDTFITFALALEYVSLGEDEKACNLFDSIYQKKPDYVALYYQYGKLMEKLNRIEDAKRLYQEGIVYAEKMGEVRTRAELFTALQEMLDM